MKRPRWTPERRETLKAMWTSGEHLSVIAEALGISRAAVTQRASLERLPPHPLKWMREGSAPLRQAVRLMLEEGMRPAEAALTTGANVNSLRATASMIRKGKRPRRYKTQEQAA